jgi:drug/metabolite transporter (DMT)-like permease
VPWTVFVELLYAATAAGALGSLLWYAAVRRLGPARTAVYANLESFFAVVSAAVFLGERVEWTAIAGGVAVVAGVLLTRRGARRDATTAR